MGAGDLLVIVTGIHDSGGSIMSAYCGTSARQAVALQVIRERLERLGRAGSEDSASASGRGARVSGFGHLDHGIRGQGAVLGAGFIQTG